MTIDHVFKAFSDETRRQLLDRLRARGWQPLRQRRQTVEMRVKVRSL